MDIYLIVPTCCFAVVTYCWRRRRVHWLDTFQLLAVHLRLKRIMCTFFYLQLSKAFKRKVSHANSYGIYHAQEVIMPRSMPPPLLLLPGRWNQIVDVIAWLK
jgi:hypothetical protein